MTPRPLGRRLALVLLAGALSASCGNDPAAPEFDPSLGIDLASMTRSASGLYYRDLVVGTGDAAQGGDTATVGYSGWLTDGTLFDSGSFAFILGAGHVISGFDEGVAGMKVGGKRKLVIPPGLGYGNRSNGPIPANSTLVFEVDLQKLGG